jgi:hypothetical protein
MLISWEISKERSPATNYISSIPRSVVQKIKDEGREWILAGAKHLAEIVS